MKILLLDSRPDEYYKSSSSETPILGHNLQINLSWPVEVSSNWNDFEKILKESRDLFGALLIHTSDALGVSRSTSPHADVANALIKYGADKPVLFFSGAGLSGDPLLFEQAMQGYSGSARACSLSEVKRLIRAFGESETHDCSVFEIFPTEVALQALSVLLPIGLLWEIHDSKTRAVEVIREADQAEMTEFEKQIQSYSVEVIRNEEGADAFRGRILDEQNTEYRILRQWLSKLGRGDARKITNGIDDLLSRNSVSAWNVALGNLRNDWLQ